MARGAPRCRKNEKEVALLTLAVDSADSGSVVVRRLCAQVAEVHDVVEKHTVKVIGIWRPDRSDAVAYHDRLHLILVLRVVLVPSWCRCDVLLGLLSG